MISPVTVPWHASDWAWWVPKGMGFMGGDNFMSLMPRCCALEHHDRINRALAAWSLHSCLLHPVYDLRPRFTMRVMMRYEQLAL